jgi:hypothetical protein
MNGLFKLGVLLVLFIAITYLMDLYKVYYSKKYEGFVSSQCPTTLIKKENKIFLYNPDMEKVPGVNPIKLRSLSEYEDYIKWQRSSGLKCPILHLEEVCDTQGKQKYEVRKSFHCDEPVGPSTHKVPKITKPPCMDRLLDANIDNDVKFNQNMFPAFDPYNQDIGKVIETALK